MSGARVTIRLDDKAALAAIGRLRRVAFEVMQPIGIALVETTKERFIAGEDLDGHRWAPLNPAYATIKPGPGFCAKVRCRCGTESGAAL